MNPLRPILIAIALSLAIVAPASAQNFQRGNEAYERGDFATALREWRPLADMGSAPLQALVADIYVKRKDYVNAARYHRMAAEQGRHISQEKLGIHYLLGWGVPKDFVLAYMWTNLAAAQGSDDATQRLKK